MTKDYGFDLPDARHMFYSNGERVTVSIVRQWYQEDEEDETRFKVSFDIKRGSVTTHLPQGCDEVTACGIAHQLYKQTKEDIEDTNSDNETEAIYAAERRMGA